MASTNGWSEETPRDAGLPFSTTSPVVPADLNLHATYVPTRPPPTTSTEGAEAMSSVVSQRLARRDATHE